MDSQLTVIGPTELMRQATDIASICREIAIAGSVEIQGRKYLRVEPWMAIATAHGCCASARDVKRVEGGYVATGELRRMSDGNLIATAEGFVGEDEPTWFGGETNGKTLAKRPDYAIRAMCQTRAISRVCRSAFAHVVVLMNAGLSTTPAEEVPAGGFDNDEPAKLPEKRPAQLPLISKGTTVTNVATKEGNSNGKPWKVTFIEFANGLKAGTFDAKIATDAGWMKESGKLVDVQVKPGKKPETFEIVSLTEADDVP